MAWGNDHDLVCANCGEPAGHHIPQTNWQYSDIYDSTWDMFQCPDMSGRHPIAPFPPASKGYFIHPIKSIKASNGIIPFSYDPCANCGNDYCSHQNGITCSLGGRIWQARDLEKLICNNCHRKAGSHFCGPNAKVSNFYEQSWDQWECPDMSSGYAIRPKQKGQFGYFTYPVPNSMGQGTINIPKNVVPGTTHTITVGKTKSTTVLSAAINNHTCKHCGNKKCSTTEKSCWLCGGKL